MENPIGRTIPDSGIRDRNAARSAVGRMAALAVALALEAWPGVPVRASMADDYAIGADLSFLKQQEDAGKEFKDEGIVSPGLVLFRRHGYNWIRLRLFHTPASLPNSLPYTLAMAKQAKAMGYRFLLDFHYSDTWADPGSQAVPKAWAGLDHAGLVDSVYRYTRDVIARFRAEGALPDMVQVGNEINNGMIWPDGKGDWNRQADLLKAGVSGVDSGRGEGPAPRIMLHIACGGDTSATKWFFDNAGKSGIKYDVIGQCYYPLWHGTLDDLRRNMAFMAGRYGKDIVVVETAFTAFPDGSSPFPLTAEGQAQYLREIDKIVRGTPGGRGKGFLWWEPTGDDYLGTPRGLFDLQRNARPGLKVFDGIVAIHSGPRGRSSPGKAPTARTGGHPMLLLLPPEGAPGSLFTPLGQRALPAIVP
ncbi:MAG: Arabinogalactan endo,4-beta-galactosidase [Fibrobacteres bacterium]|nr:Arabinogalactan endo,4-beta-galactosidase [Fibrobacterota bacterium]